MVKLRSQIPQVAIVLEMSHHTCREMLSGILQYECLHGPWSLNLMEGRTGEQNFLNFRSWGADGIIAIARKEEVVDAVIASHLPTVLVDLDEHYRHSTRHLSKYSHIECDSAAVGKAGANYLLQLGFKHFGYVHDPANLFWSRKRGKAFAKILAEHGHSCHFYSSAENPCTGKFSKSHSLSDQDRLMTWLKSLPKPIALMAAMDVRGRHVLNCCMMAQISVPHEVVVLGVDNDKLLCETANPPLSSIQMNVQQAFFQVAGHLNLLMQSKTRKKVVLHYGPELVVARRSTEPIRTTDKIVSTALEFIWINSVSDISVGDVVRHLDISRRSLELKFQKTLGCSIIEEISNSRLERVKSLLRETELSIGEIANVLGFNTESYLGKMFKKKFNMTMSEFRKES